MKKFLSLVTIVTFVIVTSCSKEENNTIIQGSVNTLSIVFETSFNEEFLKLGKEYDFKGDKLKINAFDFIAGNFILTDKDGNDFVYPKEKSFFIVSQGGKKMNKKTHKNEDVPKKLKIELKNIPAGKYKTIKFGIGVDEETYKKGNQFANNLWEKAEKHALVWSWATGYKFLALEGTVKIAAKDKAFKYHVAAAANDGLYKKGKESYKEIEIDLTNTPFLVDKKKSPQVHLLIDASKLLSNIKVSENTTLMGPKAIPIANGSKDMFTYKHTHYNETNH